MRASNENAAQRMTYSGSLSQIGILAKKESVLLELPQELAELHVNGTLHIHDLDAFGCAPNCLMVDIRKCFPFACLNNRPPLSKILAVFEFIRSTIANLANEQTGGIGFGDFDEDLGWLLDMAGADLTNPATCQLIEGGLVSLIEWINTVRTRYGLECYYVTLNIGVARSPSGRFIAQMLLNCFRHSLPLFTRPNIVFKVKGDANLAPGAPNRNLLDQALALAAERMFPTFFLCDATPIQSIPPSRLAVMGCRTRVVQNEFGEPGSIGRGNLGYVTINLPRIAANAVESATRNVVAHFKENWDIVANSARRILMLRFNQLLKRSPMEFPYNFEIGAWSKDFDNPLGIEGVFQHGTLSVGFVGLAEAVEILGAGKLDDNQTAQSLAYDICAYMRQSVDSYREQEGLNFTLLGTSAEYCPGRFALLDQETLGLPQAKKGYYTNSFHLDVSAEVHPFRKIGIEGPFHGMCNGGAVTYIEFKEAPIGNSSAIEDLIRAAINAGIIYFGINFPRDICRLCGNEGVFDNCSTCGSANIVRLRRVSGYIEDLAYFTSGKKAEVKRRYPLR